MSVVLLSLLLIVSAKPYYSRYNDETCSGDIVQQSTVESGECFPSGDGKSTRYVISGDHVKVGFFDLPNCQGLNQTVTAVSGVCAPLNGTHSGSLRVITAAKLQSDIFPGRPAGSPAPAANKTAKAKKKAAKKAGGAHYTTTCAPSGPKGRATKPAVVPMPSLFPKGQATGSPASSGAKGKGKAGKNAKKAAKKKAAKKAKKAAKKKGAKKNSGVGTGTLKGLFP